MFFFCDSSLVVWYVPATDVTRVRIPAVAFIETFIYCLKVPFFSFGPVAQSGLERWSYKTTFGTTLGKPEVWGSNQMVTLIWYAKSSIKLDELTSFAIICESPRGPICPVGVARPIIQDFRGEESNLRFFLTSKTSWDLGSNSWLYAFDTQIW